MLRAGVARPVVGLNEQPLVSYHLMTAADLADDASGAPPAWQAFAKAGSVMPLLKPLRARPDGELELGVSPALERFLDAPQTPGSATTNPTTMDAPGTGAGWRHEGSGGGVWVGKHFSAQTVQWLDAELGDGMLSARIAIERGLRAGLVLRASGDGATGQRIVLDRNFGCIEWGTLNAPAPLDRRRWQPRGGWIELRVIAHGPSIEIYCDGKLMLHQVRYRETGDRVALVADNAEARFEAVELRPLRRGVPLLNEL
jgi:hypothetical protein